MGAYSPTLLVGGELMDQVEREIFVPTIHAMKRRRMPFRGILYAGLMITKQGLKVLEFNVRFGDPEAQPILMRLKSDLAVLLDAAVDRRLTELEPLEWDPRSAVCVVIASNGYPHKYTKGLRIMGLEDTAATVETKVFHAGTTLRDSQIVTDGGRVLGVTAVGESVAAAKRRAYESVRTVRFQGAWCRQDISDKALVRLLSSKVEVAR